MMFKLSYNIRFVSPYYFWQKKKVAIKSMLWNYYRASIH